MFYRALSRRDLVIGGTLLGLAGGTAAAGPQTPGTADVRILRAREGAARLAGSDRAAIPIWGFDGIIPGPTLRARRGEEFRVRLVNDLPEPMALHWHGLRLANVMDGVPHLTQPPIAPGGTFDYSLASPDAGTFWYHAARPTGRAHGLSGLLLVDEIETVTADRDIALLLDAWRANGSSPPQSPRSEGGAGQRQPALLTVNGLATLDIAVRTNERIRLRLVNASDTLMTVRVDRHRVHVMALDGQPTEPFVARDGQLFLGPGNRADILLDALLPAAAIAPIDVETEDGARALARLVYAEGTPARSAALPEPPPLPANPLPARMDFAGAVRRDLPITGADAKPAAWWWRTGADDRPPGQPMLSVQRGRVVMLAFANHLEAPVVLHVHGHAFRLLDRLDDGWKPFWLDTVVVPPRQTARIAFVADNPGKWLIEGRVLGPHAAAPEIWFEVT